MPATRGAFVAQRGNVDWGNDDALAGTGRGLGEHASVEVDDLAAARP
jgi:hypothetical protein